MLNSQVLWSYPGQQLVHNLLHQINECQSDDALQPVTVVVPNRITRRRLLYRLLDLQPQGFMNVNLMSMAHLVYKLDDAEGQTGEQRERNGTFELELIRDISGQPNLPSGPLSEFLQEPNFHQILLQTFDALENVPDEKLQLLLKYGERYKQILELFKLYCKRRSQFTARHQSVERVVQRIADAEYKLPPELGNLVLVLPNLPEVDFSNVWETLMQVPKTKVVATLPEQMQQDGIPPHLLTRGMGWPSTPSDVTVVQAGLEQRDIKFCSAIDQLEEARAVTHDIMERARAGINFSRMAVLTPNTRYSVRLIEALQSSGIPVSATGGIGRSLQAQKEFIEGIRAMTSSAKSVTEFRHWLSVVNLKQNENSLIAWLRLIKDAKTSSMDMLRRYLKTAPRYKGASTSAENFLTFADQLKTALDARKHTTWQELSEWFKGLLTEYYQAPADAMELESALTQVAKFDEAGVTNPSVERFLNAVYDIVSTSFQPATNPEGVLVTTLNSVSLAVFDTVFIIGMTDGLYPLGFNTLGMLTESVAKELDPAEESLHTRTTATLLEQYRFSLAIESATEVNLYWPRIIGDRNTYPAPWFIDLIRANSKHDIKVEDVMSLTDGVVNNKDLNALELAITSEPYNQALTTAANTEDYDLLTVARARVDESHHLNSDPLMTAFQHRNEVIQDEARLSEYEGNLQAFFVKLPPQVYKESASSYGTFRRCPYDYFLQKVLKLDIEEMVVDDQTISRLDRGSLMHEILEKFVNERDTSKQQMEQWAQLQSVAKQCFDNAVWRVDTGLVAMWNVEKALMTRALARWLEADIAHLERGWETLKTEMAFGVFGSRHTDLAGLRLGQPDGGTVEFRGQIDRLDRHQTDDRYLVIDYKTSAKAESKKSLQLPIYAAVLREMHQNAPIYASYIYLLRNDGKGIEVNYEFDEQEELARLKQDVADIYSAVSTGIFPPKTNCANCGGVVQMLPRTWYEAREISNELREICQ